MWQNTLLIHSVHWYSEQLATMLHLTAAVQIVIVAVACLSQVKAEFIIEVEVHSFRNPMSILRDGNCCDPSNVRPPLCSSECEESFVFCFREFGRSDEDTSEGSCPYGRRVSGVLNTPNSDDIMFTIGESFPSGVSNPLVGSGASYPGSIQLAIKVTDVDSSPDDELELFLVDINIPVGTDFSLVPETHFGIFRNDEHTIELNFKLNCMANFFGPNCITFCMERDDDQGHYTCGSDGSFVCLQGYQNPATNCTECIPAEGCSPVGGFCNIPDECICLEGYGGESCLIDLDPCGRTFPCRNGSTCMNTGSGDYVCLCPEGFSGRDCEQDGAGILTGGVVGGIVGGLLLLVGAIFLCVVLVKGVVVRRNWKTYKEEADQKPSLNQELNKSKKTNAPTFTSLPGDNMTYAGAIGYHVYVDKTPTPLNNTETITGVAEEHEFDNPLYADSASLSDLYDQRSTGEPAAPGISKGQDYSEIISHNQIMSRDESSSVSHTDEDYEFDSNFYVNVQTPK